MGYIYVYMLLKGYFSKWPPGGATGALWGARGAFCGLPAPHMGCIYVYMLLKGYFSKWPPGGATGALGGLEAPSVGSQYLIWGISMYIYYVYTTKSIGSKSVTRRLRRLRKKKQRYKIPSQSARDLKRLHEQTTKPFKEKVII